MRVVKRLLISMSEFDAKIREAVGVTKQVYITFAELRRDLRLSLEFSDCDLDLTCLAIFTVRYCLKMSLIFRCAIWIKLSLKSNRTVFCYTVKSAIKNASGGCIVYSYMEGYYLERYCITFACSVYLTQKEMLPPSGEIS